MELANVLYYNRTITYLDLSENSIGDDGVIVISTALRYHPRMKHLDVSYNDMTEDGQFEMLQCLKHNESIGHVFGVDCQEISSVLIQSIDDYNDTLHNVCSVTLSEVPRGAPKKGSGRRQHMFTWMSINWIEAIHNDCVSSNEI
jgi:Leucine Rich repeat